MHESSHVTRFLFSVLHLEKLSFTDIALQDGCTFDALKIRNSFLIRSLKTHDYVRLILIYLYYKTYLRLPDVFRPAPYRFLTKDTLFKIDGLTSEDRQFVDEVLDILSDKLDKSSNDYRVLALHGSRFSQVDLLDPITLSPSMPLDSFQIKMNAYLKTLNPGHSSKEYDLTTAECLFSRIAEVDLVPLVLSSSFWMYFAYTSYFHGEKDDARFRRIVHSGITRIQTPMAERRYLWREFVYSIPRMSTKEKD